MYGHRGCDGMQLGIREDRRDEECCSGRDRSKSRGKERGGEGREKRGEQRGSYTDISSPHGGTGEERRTGSAVGSIYEEVSEHKDRSGVPFQR